MRRERGIEGRGIKRGRGFEESIRFFRFFI